MMKYLDLVFSVTVISVIVIVNAQYEVPDVRVEALTPKGLRVSIEDEDGISLFAFHGKINEEMQGREAGTFSVDINKAKNGRWTYFTKAPKLKVGDVIYYWVNVDYNDGNGKRGYIKDDQTFTVTELIPDDTASTTSTTTTTTTSRPTPTPTRSRPTPTRSPPTPQTPTPTPPVITTPDCKKLSATTVKGKQRCQGELIFEEEFSNFLERRWQPELRFAGDPDYEFVIYQKSKDNLYVEKNKLNIKPTIVEDKFGEGYVYLQSGLDLGESCTGVLGTVDCIQKPRAWSILPPVFSSQISTKNSFWFKYGVIEIRARLPKGDWIYPEIYLKSKNDDYGPGLDSGLMKIAYTFGNDDNSKTLYGGCVLGQTVAARNYAVKSIRSIRHWNNDTHVFKLEWKTDSITLSVNDQVYGNIFPPEGGFAAEEHLLELDENTVKRWKTGTDLAPFDKDMYIVLGVGVGGQTFPIQENGEKPWDNYDPKAQLNFYKDTQNWRKTWSQDSKLVVESVKVWAL